MRIILTYILSHTVFWLPLSSGQIIAFDKGVPPVNTLILRNLCEYRRKSYIIAKAGFFGLRFCRNVI